MSEPDDRFDGPPLSDPPKSEAVFNAPLSVVVVALSMPVLFFFQRQLPDMGASMAFAPIDLQNGRWGGLFTAMLLHGGWAHALMNAAPWPSARRSRGFLANASDRASFCSSI